ncbi:MAG: hypothetical protein KGI75_25785 [Rhizobiaceae bacterium]|nr:hypothetical protein [Rhizobiaceae bacterium]
MGSGKDDDSPKPSPGQKPRVLFGENAVAPVPSANPAIGPEPKVLFGSPQAPAPKSNQPKIIAAGQVRRRIACDAAALRAIDPNASEPILAQAQKLVDATNLDDHYFEDVVQFGAVLQARHASLSEDELNLASDPALARIRQLGSDFLVHLDALDPERVFAVQGGVLGAIRSIAGAGAGEALFSRHYAEIKALAAQLDALSPDVAALADNIRSLQRRYAQLAQDIDAHLLAAQFLIAHMCGIDPSDRERQAHYLSQLDALETRLASLSGTRISIDVAVQTIGAIRQMVDGLRLFGEDLVRSELPAWQAAYSAALAARAMEPGRAAGIPSLLRDIHRRMLTKLRPKG